MKRLRPAVLLSGSLFELAGFLFAQSEWTCEAAGGVGASCARTPWYKDALCDDLDTATCLTPKLFLAPTPAGSGTGCGQLVETN